MGKQAHGILGRSILIPTRWAALALVIAALALGATACGDEASAPRETAADDFACAPTPPGVGW